MQNDHQTAHDQRHYRLATLRRLYHHIINGGTTNERDEALCGLSPITADGLSNRIGELEREIANVKS